MNSLRSVNSTNEMKKPLSFRRSLIPRKKTRQNKALPKSISVVRSKANVIPVDSFSQKIYEKIKKIHKPENSAEYIEFLKDTINRIDVFKHLTENEVECLISNMFYCEAQLDQNYIFKQNSVPSCCLIID